LCQASRRRADFWKGITDKWGKRKATPFEVAFYYKYLFILFVTVFAQTLLPLMSGDFMTFFLSSARHLCRP